MQTGRVGVHLEANEAQFMAQLKRMSEGMAKLFSGFDPMGGKQGGGAGGGGSKGKPGSPFEEAAKAAKQANELIRQQEEKTAKLREQYTEKYTRFGKEKSRTMTKALVDDMKRLQDESQRIRGAMAKAEDKATKDHLRRTKSAVDEEIRLRKTIAMDDPKVMRAGAGAKAGIMGIGRDVASALPIPGAGMLASLATPAGAATAAIGAVVGALSFVIEKGREFDSAMTKSTAIMGNLSEETTARMRDVAKQTAKDLNMAASEAADSYFFLASAGMNAEQSMAALPVVATFAKAGMFDMALATDLATDAQSALGLSSKDAQKNMQGLQRVTDVFVKANTLANTSVQQVSEAMTNKAGPALRSVGKDIEEGTAVLAAFADQGIKGKRAGELLANMTRDMQTAALKNQDAFKAQNVAVFDAQGEMRNYADIIADLEKALDGKSDAEKKATLSLLGFKDKSQGGIMALAGMSDKMRGYEKDLRSAGGTSQEIADKQMKSFDERMKSLSNVVELTAIGIFESLMPAFEILFSILAPILEGLAWLITAIIDIITWSVEANIAILEWTGVLGFLEEAFNAIVEVVTLAIEWFSNLWANLSDGDSTLRKQLQPAIDWVGNALAWLGGIVRDVAGFLSDVFNRAVADVGAKLSWIWGILSDVAAFIGRVFSGAWDLVSGAVARFGGNLGFLKKPIEAVVGWIKDLVGWAKDAAEWVGNLFSSAGEANAAVTKAEASAPPDAAAAPEPPKSNDPRAQAEAGLRQRLVDGEISQTEFDEQLAALGPSKGGGGLPSLTKEKKPKAKTKAQIEKEKVDAAKSILETRLKDEQTAIELAFERREITEEQKNGRLKDREIAFYADLKAMYEANVSDRVTRDRLAADAELKHMQATNARKRLTLKEEIDDLEDAMSPKLDVISDAVEAGTLSQKKAQKMQIDLELAHLEDLIALKKQFGEDTLKEDRKLAALRIRGVKVAYEAEKEEINTRYAQIIEDRIAAAEDLAEAEGRELTKLESDGIRVRALAEAAREALALMQRLNYASAGEGTKLDKTIAAEGKQEAAEGKDENARAAKAEAEWRATNVAYQAGMEALHGVVNQGTAKLDAIWSGMFKNQETIAFKALNGLYTAVKGTMSKLVTELGEKAVIFIAKNLSIAASWIANAVAAAAAWLWAINPILAVTVGGGLIAGIVSQWKGIKKTLGFAKGAVFSQPAFAPLAGGNMGVIGEAGPEVAAPLSAFPQLFRDTFGIGAGSDMSGVIDELRSLKRAVAEARPLILDGHGQKLSIDHAGHLDSLTAV